MRRAARGRSTIGTERVAIAFFPAEAPWIEGRVVSVAQEPEPARRLLRAAHRSLAALFHDLQRERFPLSEVIVAEIGLAVTMSLFLALPRTDFLVRESFMRTVGLSALPFMVLATWTLVSLARRAEQRPQRVRPLRRVRVDSVRIVPGRLGPVGARPPVGEEGTFTSDATAPSASSRRRDRNVPGRRRAWRRRARFLLDVLRSEAGWRLLSPARWIRSKRQRTPVKRSAGDVGRSERARCGDEGHSSDEDRGGQPGDEERPQLQR